MNYIKKLVLIAVSLMSMLLISSCDVSDGVALVEEITDELYDDQLSVNRIDKGYNEVLANSTVEEVIEEVEEETKELVSYTEADLVDFEPERAFEYCTKPVCMFVGSDNQLVFDIEFNRGIPRSDDDNIYIFDIASFEDEAVIDENKEPIAVEAKGKEVFAYIPYEDKLLFSRFVPTLLYEGEYIPLYIGQHILNPEAIATNTSDYLEMDSKKGILLDANTVNTDKLFDLDVRRAVYNIPLSIIIGETDNPDYPTIEYEYNGRTYYFNGGKCVAYDSLFHYLMTQGYHTTAIILNDWNENYPEIIHPMARRRTGRSLYYAFNTVEEDGTRLMEATAMFLAERYSDGEHGLIQDWVIANEINQHKVWNYMATDDVYYYTEMFESSFRTFYNAIKSHYSNARVYYSIDHDWNNNGGNNGRFFNGRDIVYTFNEIARKRGNYDWNLSIHPYPNPLNRTRFWTGSFDKTEKARILTPMNFSTLTDVLLKEDMLNPKGNVRDIGVTELGFCSKSGERLQAAAYAYCYYIIANNEYISSFLMNRQTDDADALKSGLALGIYNKDYSEKYIAEVFKNIDSDSGSDYIPEMLEILGASSLEEALSWAE